MCSNNIVNKSQGEDNHYFSWCNILSHCLIWKSHHLTASSIFLLFHVEVLPGMPASISRNVAIIFGMLVQRGFLYCRTLALTFAKSKPHAANTAYFSNAFQLVTAWPAESSASTSPKKPWMGFLSALRTSSSVLPVRHNASRISFFEVESGGPCICLEMYQDNLASKADTLSKLYQLDLKD